MAVQSRAEKGFSLIEMMIAVVIVGIVTAVALPYFENVNKRAKRAEAKDLIMKAASKQEQFFAQFVSYTSVVGGSGSCSGAACGIGLDNDESSDGHYKLTMDTGPAGCDPASDTAPMCRTYTLTVAPTGGFSDSECPGLTYSNTGAKGVKNVNDQSRIDRCWK